MNIEIDIFNTTYIKKLVAPVSYQGGKQRIALDIVTHLLQQNKKEYFDLCCGSGSISIELINQGVSPKNITMVDKGPWGIFWEAIGFGQFDLDKFNYYCNQIPSDLDKVDGFMKDLSIQSASIDTPYVFILLQAASFGSKAIWIENDKWKTCGFRRYWKPTKTSNRRSPVNPMMPMPQTLFSRIKNISKVMIGVKARCDDVENVEVNEEATIYIDPPYNGTTAYGHAFNVSDYCKKIKTICYVSEGKPLSNKSFLLNSNRTKGGISGNRKKANEEWLSLMNDKIIDV